MALDQLDEKVVIWVLSCTNRLLRGKEEILQGLQSPWAN